MQTGLNTLTILATALLIAGCASPPPTQTVMSTQGTTLVRTAYVTQVRDIAVRGGSDSGVGTAVGAVLGGLAGSTIGSGNGRTAASIGGAIVGGMAGRHIERTARSSTTTELTVRFDGGEMRTYRIEDDANFRVGDKVKVINGHDGVRITH